MVVDDDPFVVELMKRSLGDGFGEVRSYTGVDKAAQAFEMEEPRLVLLDLHLGEDSGLLLLRAMRERRPNVPVVVITADEDEDLARECLAEGASDFVQKPFTALRLSASVSRAIEGAEREQEMERMRLSMLDEKSAPTAFDSILTQSELMQRLFRLSEVVAQTERDILITGETGTGKDLLAKAIHDISGRAGEMVSVNVAGLDDAHFSDTLFGHLRGSFTGATKDRPGLVEKARGGTLFLDEIGDLSIPSQVKLLRLLQEREFLPIGSDQHVQVEIRFVCATSRPLKQMMEEGTFRRDLFYRLRAQQLHLPALRDRGEDVGLLWTHFLTRAADQLKRKVPEVSEAALAMLRQHPFQGNVRELEAMAFQGASAYKYLISELEMSRILGGQVNSIPESTGTFPELLPKVDEMIDELILEALRRCEGNQTQASKMIGMSRRGMISRIKRHHLEL